MAQKRPKTRLPKPKPKHIRLEVTQDQHSKLRVMAAEKGMSMAAFVRSVMSDTLRPIIETQHVRGRVSKRCDPTD